MKQLDLKILKNLAIVDTPGMLDSVTEKGRGYNYDGVVGEFARLAGMAFFFFLDLIVFAFLGSPRKALVPSLFSSNVALSQLIRRHQLQAPNASKS